MTGDMHSPRISTGHLRPEALATRVGPVLATSLPIPITYPPTEREANQPRWLSVDQIRKQQRMRRETVLGAMLSGELPFEQRGRIRYARECDVRAWEEKRLKRGPAPRRCEIHPDLLRYV